MASLEALPILLKELRLGTMGKRWEGLAQQALDGQWLPQQYLAALCEEEVNERYQQRLKRHLHEAQLPAGKRLSHFDFSAVHGIKANQVKALVEQPQWVSTGTPASWGLLSAGRDMAGLFKTAACPFGKASLKAALTCVSPASRSFI